MQKIEIFSLVDSRKLTIYQKIRFFLLFVEVLFLVDDISKVEAEICQLQILGCLEHKGKLLLELIRDSKGISELPLIQLFKW